MERQLREELLSALNHDLRSPLGAVGIFCEILQLNPASLDDNQRQSLSMIQEANAKAQRILDDAAELNAIYKGTVTLRRNPTPLMELVEGALGGLAETLAHKEIRYKLHGNDAAQVVVDSEKTMQVLLRLLEEAIVYCGRKGTVHLHLEERDSFAQVRIETESSAAAESTLKRPSNGSVKGRLGVRKIGESHYSVAACNKVIGMMGGDLALDTMPEFRICLRLPTSSS